MEPESGNSLLKALLICGGLNWSLLLRRQQRSNNIGFRHGFDQLHQNQKGELQMTTHSSIALITGGTSGIDRATANKLAQLGIHDLVVDRNAERGEKTVAQIRAAGGKADFISSDLRDASSAREVARRAVEIGNGNMDILINNAGIYPFGPTHETTEEVFDSVFSLNVKAPYFLVAELAPLMER